MPYPAEEEEKNVCVKVPKNGLDHTWQVSKDRLTSKSRHGRPIVLTAPQQAVRAPHVLK